MIFTYIRLWSSKKLRDKLHNAGAVASTLYPIDVDPTLSLTLNGLYRLARDLGMYVDVKSVVREVYDLISKWPEYMFDNMKLWYEIFKEGMSDFFIPFSSINQASAVSMLSRRSRSWSTWA